MPRALHPQHAAVGVGVRRIPLGRQRMQERETQAIGFPGLPSRAAQPCDRRHISAGIRPTLRNQRRARPAPERRPGQKPHGCAPPPPRSAPPAFRRHGPCARAKAPDHPACGCRARADRAPPPTRRHRIRPMARPDIEQQRARGGFQQHRAALPHVQRRQPPVSRLGPLGTPAQQRQHPEPPQWRPGQPRACKAQAMPASASSSQGQGAAATSKLAQAASPTQATGIMVRSNTASPACPAPAARRSAPGIAANNAHSRDRGVTRKLTAGIATTRQRRAHRHLAHPEGQQGRQPQRHQQLQVAGLPSLAATRRPRPADGSIGAATMRSRMATAPNDSQKPGAIGAQGSSAVTKAAATASTRPPVKAGATWPPPAPSPA